MKRLAGVAGVLAAVLVAAIVVMQEVPDRPEQAAFDKAVWDEARGCVRATMVEDLARNRLPPRMAKADTVDLLGRGVSSIRGTMNCVEYALGRCENGAKPIPEALVVCFDGNERVARVWTDPQ